MDRRRRGGVDGVDRDRSDAVDRGRSPAQNGAAEHHARSWSSLTHVRVGPRHQDAYTPAQRLLRLIEDLAKFARPPRTRRRPARPAICDTATAAAAVPAQRCYVGHSIGLLRIGAGTTRDLAATFSNGKGARVARKRPTASDVPQSPAHASASSSAVAVPDGDDALTHAQMRALRRCAPLNTAEFKAQRLVVAQQHRFSVQRILRRSPARRDPS